MQQLLLLKDAQFQFWNAAAVIIMSVKLQSFQMQLAAAIKLHEKRLGILVQI